MSETVATSASMWIARIMVGLAFGIAGWTVTASLVFLVGTGLFHDFTHPFYQWWLYALNDDGNLIVDRWLKIGAAAGVVPLVLMAIAAVLNGRKAVGPKLIRPFWGGLVRSPLAVTDNHGHAAWMSMKNALERFPGPCADYGGIVVGEAYRVDQDKKAGKRFVPSDPKTWGQGGKAQLLIDPCQSGPTHSLVVSGSGGFKSTTAVSTLLYWTGPAVVLDVAGELAPMLTEAREAMGQKVFELDPSSGKGFNVLEWIDPKSPMAAINIETVVTWVCGDMPKDKQSNNDFFDKMGRNVVRCLIAHVLADTSGPPETKTLRAVRHVIAMPTEQVRAILRSIYENSESAYAKQQAGPICGLVDETFSGVVGSAAELTSWLANEAFVNLVSGTDFTIKEFLSKRSTLFIKMPLKVLESTPGVSRTIIGALLQAAYEADGNIDGRVLYLLDEVARLGYMKILETARDAGRKYGITLQLLYQSGGQIVEQWGEQGKRAWYASVSYRCYAAVQDFDTAKDLSESFGTYGVMASSEGSNSGSSGKGFETSSRSRGANTSYHEISRPLIRESEIMNDTRDDEMFVLMRGAPPLRCGRAIYFRRPEMTRRVGVNRFYKAQK